MHQLTEPVGRRCIVIGSGGVVGIAPIIDHLDWQPAAGASLLRGPAPAAMEALPCCGCFLHPGCQVILQKKAALLVCFADMCLPRSMAMQPG